MQREINFRVWCKDFGEWEKDYCFLSQKGLIYQMHSKGVRCIRPESHIAQFFTGLFDKNSLPIFEGDIISCEEKMMDGMPDYKRPIAVVIWDGCCWCYSLDKEREWKNPHQILRFAKNIEVIGSIFENPELLQC